MKIIIKSLIKNVRKDKGVSVRDLSERTGISKTYISDVENDHKMPTLYTLCVIAVALNVKPEKLYNYTVINDL